MGGDFKSEGDIPYEGQYIVVTQGGREYYYCVGKFVQLKRNGTCEVLIFEHRTHSGVLLPYLVPRAKFYSRCWIRAASNIEIERFNKRQQDDFSGYDCSRYYPNQLRRLRSRNKKVDDLKGDLGRK